ncbi:transposable element Tcb1 transposase [Trichonephila clavipes]|nr:transposable element Tcb1 transposase [Trichonephila clavipes]
MSDRGPRNSSLQRATSTPVVSRSFEHHSDDFLRGRIIGKLEKERKITDVAREFDIAHCVVSPLWKSFKTTGMCSRRRGGGRVRSTTPAEDRYIVLSAKRNRRTTAQQVANQFLAAPGKQISRKTVARRLRGGGLYARRTVVCVLLTRQHRTARLQWCREHHNWTEQDWACVLFSDESRFSLLSDCRRQLIWRESGTAYRPENIQEKDRYPTCSIMVWAGVMINGRTRLHMVVNGTMTGQRYIDEVLLPHVRLFRGAVGDKFVFYGRQRNMSSNTRCSGLSRQRGQVAGRNYHPTNKNTLIRALTEERDKLPQQLLDNVMQRGKQFRTKLTEKLISENHRDEFSATSGRPSISPLPLRLTSMHFPEVIPASEKKSNPTRQCSRDCAPVIEIPEISQKYIKASKKDMTLKFGIPPNSLSTIIRNRDKLRTKKLRFIEFLFKT